LFLHDPYLIYLSMSFSYSALAPGCPDPLLNPRKSADPIPPPFLFLVSPDICLVSMHESPGPKNKQPSGFFVAQPVDNLLPMSICYVVPY
jgi:hypothetical protein